MGWVEPQAPVLYDFKNPSANTNSFFCPSKIPILYICRQSVLNRRRFYPLCSFLMESKEGTVQVCFSCLYSQQLNPPRRWEVSTDSAHIYCRWLIISRTLRSPSSIRFPLAKWFFCRQFTHNSLWRYEPFRSKDWPKLPWTQWLLEREVHCWHLWGGGLHDRTQRP